MWFRIVGKVGETVKLIQGATLESDEEMDRVLRSTKAHKETSSFARLRGLHCAKH